MPMASYVVGDFRGGEWSQTAQGMIADPHYKIALNLSLNAYPLESGAHARRPGFRLAAPTRGGGAGRVISFDFKAASPYNIEFTDSYMRFFNGTSPVMTNDAQAVSSISTANPAKVATGAAHGWTGTITCAFNSLGVNNPLLQNRQFTGTITSTTELTLADALTGASIDGSTLGSFVSGNITRVNELASPYGGTDWRTLRAVQADTNAILLQSIYPPYVLSVVSQPTAAAFANFAVEQANFVDGPYLDPVPGALITPSGVTGLISLTIAYQTYSASVAYSSGDVVTYSGSTYESLVDQNLNNQPDTHPVAWLSVVAAIGVGPNGFESTDIGRHLRLFSEPANWNSATTYGAGGTNVVKYNGVYWTSLAGSNTNNQPGIDLTKWALNAAAAVWSWGKITAITGSSASMIGRTSGTAIGNMSGGGGLAAAFNGTTSQVATSGARSTGASTRYAYVGKDYHTFGAQQIAYGLFYSSSNEGTNSNGTGGGSADSRITINLRAKHTSPSSHSDGTLLGTTGLIANFLTGPVQIVSNDQTTAWEYVFFEIVNNDPGGAASIDCAQAQFFNLVASAGTGCQIQLLGPSLLYTTALSTWRLGLYSATTGWPSCGTYHEGRLWLSGAVANRFDGSRPIVIAQDGSIDKFDFAPTESDGTVADSNAISYTLNSPDVNPIFWMEPDHQGILMGTQAGEWLVQASANNNPLTPTSIQAHRVTRQGSANIEPRRTDHTLILVQKFQRKVCEYFADVFSGKFSAPDLNEKAKHLTASGIAEIAYQQELTPIVWARLASGGLIGATYQRDSLASSQGPTFCGWHKHTLGSGRSIASICVGGNSDGTLDALAMTTLDAGTGVYHVEVMSKLFEEGDALTTARQLDDAIIPSSYVASGTGVTFYGLWYLNGKTVSVFAGGLDLGDFTVSSGSVVCPFTSNALFTSAFVAAYAGAMPCVVGFTFTSQGQLVRPDTQPESGARNGPGFGKKRRVHRFAAKLVNALGISFGTSFSRLRAAKFTTNGGVPYAANAMFTGIYAEEVDDDAEGYDGMLCWQVSRPFPATVAAISGFIDTKDQ